MKAVAYRTNRSTYGVLLAIFVAVVAVLVSVSSKPGPTEVIAAFIVIPRLHDIGRSGWWYVAIVMVEIAMVVGGFQLGGIEGGQMAAGIFAILALLGLMLLALIPGQPMANRWGYPPDPGISFKRPKTPEQRLEEIF